VTASVENSPHSEAMVLDTERLFGEHMCDVQVFDHINQCIEHLFDYKYFQVIPVIKPESEQQQ
jgi:hypothetical protein